MVLTSLIRSFREHDWFAAFVELILLVAGIFLGFQLDRWNDQRLDQLRADEYRQQLIVDLQLEMKDLDQLVAYHRAVRDFAEIALTAWSDEPAADPEALIVALYQASNVVPYILARGAFDALTSQGLIDLVGGPQLSSRLSAYYSQQASSIFTEEKAYRMELRGAMPVAIQRQIVEACTSISVVDSMTEELSKDCELGLGPDQARLILEEIIAHPKLRFYLRQAIARDTTFIHLMEAKRLFIVSLLADLRALR
jgi:hypothetical protein